MTVKWKGPNGEIDEESNEGFVKIIYHRVLKQYFSKEDLNDTVTIGLSGLDYLRGMYANKKLSSRYHNLGHNYVTTITAIKVFIGAILQGHSFQVDELLSLILAGLFHDSGYLLDSKKAGKSNIKDHTANSIIWADVFLRRASIRKQVSSRTEQLIKYTNYSQWSDYETEVQKDELGRILIGSDFMQVTDKRYFFNRKALSEYLYGEHSTPDINSERKFFKFAKEVTSSIWHHLDEFYKSSKSNPYREGWERFVDGFSMILDTKPL